MFTFIQRWIFRAGCAVCVLMLWSGVATARNDTSHPTLPPKVPSYFAVLVKDLIDQEPTRQFDCLGRVYLYMTFYKVYGPHRVTAIWYNPQGKQQDAKDLDFNGTEDEVPCWLALEFLNVHSERNPMLPNTAAAKFKGKWNVKVLLDGNELETLQFTVACG